MSNARRQVSWSLYTIVSVSDKVREVKKLEGRDQRKEEELKSKKERKKTSLCPRTLTKTKKNPPPGGSIAKSMEKAME